MLPGSIELNDGRESNDVGGPNDPRGKSLDKQGPGNAGGLDNTGPEDDGGPNGGQCSRDSGRLNDARGPCCC